MHCTMLLETAWVKDFCDCIAREEPRGKEKIYGVKLHIRGTLLVNDGVVSN